MTDRTDHLTEAAERGVDALRLLVRDTIRAGVSEETVLAELEVVRTRVPDEVEDLVLEVMDQVVGWCSPGMRLDEAGEP